MKETYFNNLVIKNENKVDTVKWNLKRAHLQFFLFLFITVIFFMIGLRPETIGTDTINYSIYYEYVSKTAFIPETKFEFFFHWLIQLCSYFSFSFSNFLSVIALLNFTLIAILTKKLDELAHYKIGYYRLLFLLLSSLFLSPFFFSMTTNVIRQGIAILALGILYLSFSYRTSFISLLLFGLIALCFHKTSIIVLGLVPLLLLPYSTVFKTSLFLSLSYISGLTIKMINVFSATTGIDIYSHLIMYGAKNGYNSGVRYDFALFTVILGLGFDCLNRYLVPNENRATFNQLLKIYWIFSLPFFILGFGAYSDRFLLTGWFFISVLSCFLVGSLMKKYRCSVRWDICILILASFYYLGKLDFFIM